MSPDHAARAVVLGGSIAGTLAARVLADHYGEVVVVDRDAVLGVDRPRRGAPQAAQAHGLHGRGLTAIEALFPGLQDELVARRLPRGDLGEMHWYVNARLLAPARTGLPSVTPQRPVLEDHLRTRTAALPAVRYRERTDVLGLVTTPDRRRVTGVRLQEHGGEPEVLTADLVVDTTGRGSRTPVWLDELGYGRPPEERMRIGLAYTTRIYRSRPEWFDGVQSINLIATPSHPRGCFFGQVSHDEAILSLTGINGDRPPTDPAGFAAFVRSLPVSRVHDAVVDAEALTPAVSFAFPASVRRRYERMAALPDGLHVLGDAACSFNPVYGQGMSVAALEVTELAERLAAGRTDPAGFQRAVARIIDTPWEISTSGDLDFPSVPGRRSLTVRAGNAFMSRVQRAAVVDPAVTAAYMRVAGLAAPPQSMMRPGMVARVLRRSAAVPPPVPAPAPAAVPTGHREAA